MARIVLMACAALALAAAAPAAAFQVQGIFQFGPAHVGIAFTDSVNAAQALQLSRYTLTPQGATPAIVARSVTLQDNQRTIILSTATPLAAGAAYSVTVTGVGSRNGDPLEPGGPNDFTTVAEVVTGIADVHATINDRIGQTVTLIGQVYITGSSSGGTPSGYIQDGTGRGLNVFGTPLQLAADTLGNVVKVTGTVALYFTTVELTPFTATTVASRMPHLAPRILSVAQASSPQWEGTYIRCTATLTGAPSASGANNYTYPAEDLGQAFMFRVRNSTGVDPGSYFSGDLVTGAGAGTAFQGTYQITVGNAADLKKGTAPGDITPPVLIAASGMGGESAVHLEFSEPLAAGGATASNYTVHPTAAPGSPVAVTAANPSGVDVSLVLASPLVAGTAYTVTVANAQDLAGNTVPPDSRAEFVAATPAAFAVSGVFQFGSGALAAAYNQAVNASQALDAARYAFSPPLAIASLSLQENGRTVVFRTAAPLPRGASYSISVTGVTSASGEALASPGPFALETASEIVTDIATIQESPGDWSGQTVTVVGQVTIPVGSRGGTPSGYIEDASGRGLNLFGGAIQGAVNELGNVVKVTGLVEVYFTTTEITGYTTTLLASDVPNLAARRISALDANDARWEGTYIEVAGEITDIQPSGTSNVNYTLTDGEASIVARVGNGLGIESGSFVVGDAVVARGAGAQFQSTYQVAVGNKDDLFKPGGGGPDVTPPSLTSASGAVGSPSVTLQFSEALRTNEATLLSSYRLHRSGAPEDSLEIVAAMLAFNGRSVYLTLAAPLASGTAYTAQASGLADLAGNVMPAPVSVSVSVTEAAPAGAVLLVPPTTLIRNLTRQGEVLRFEIAGVPDTRAVCRVFDLQGRLVKVLFDGRLTGAPRRTLSWDARDEMFELVPAGVYICHLETTDNSGRVTRARAPIVVALRLD